MTIDIEGALDDALAQPQESTGLPSPQPVDFIAIDTETANETRGSLCSIGVAMVNGGEVVATGEQIIDPQQDFNPYNTLVNGLDEDDVAGAPTLSDIWPDLTALLHGQQVVTHNASFDASVLMNSAAFAGVEGGPAFDLYCTYRMAKAAWPAQPSFSLGYIAPELGIDFDHHVAGEDARACAEVLLALYAATGVASLPDLSEHLLFRPGHVETGVYEPFRTSKTYSSLGNIDADPRAAEDHPLYGLAICFTGTLASMPRQQAAEEVTKAGADFKNGVSKKLNILVIGDADFMRFAEGWETTKLKKAKALSAEGVAIEIMSERDFLRMLDGAGV